MPALNSTRDMTLTDLTRVEDYYVRVRAAGPNYEPWSDVATTMVA